MSRMPALAMSHLIAPDALSSPPSESHTLPVPWDAHLQPACTGVFYAPQAMPVPATAYMPTIYAPQPQRVLKSSRMSTPHGDKEQTLCIPTHQVFDIPPNAPVPSPSPSPSPAPEQQLQPRLSISINPSTVPQKRPCSSAGSTSKKVRGGERTSTKDFVPPDVSGLSKREARLVKNRAAAFLSRQRKREEFETMEIGLVARKPTHIPFTRIVSLGGSADIPTRGMLFHRVAELEQENARLLALTQQTSASPKSDENLMSEVEQLRSQLAALEERERVLAEELERQAVVRSPSPAPSASSAGESDVKMEEVGPLRSTRTEKSGASLGLMVLLCALPTLLSMPSHSHHSQVPNTLSLPLSHINALPPFDMQSIFPSSLDTDWPFDASHMDLDMDKFDLDFDLDKDDSTRFASAAPMVTRKLEIEGTEVLGPLDISFDTSSAENGKIRVRIHPLSSAVSSTTSSASVSSAGSPPAVHFEDDSSISSSLTSESSVPSPKPDADADALGPFLGVPGNFALTDDEFSSLSQGHSAFDYDSFSDSGYSYGSRAGSPGASAGGRRRVRIALKNIPGRGREGGEWEIELC
ncbi:predicted protein [Postia placenta Mad-698-R]|uniref:BZIP domain-containing protein n=1 Tax=Postia placenta MAD-698-R-SB12 TaxID=670580 RepID=A0A1X6MZ77_9APHY|nr:hypothetical protein POSPLADRAFT_1046955 [Postia placenta MAD-698-R-SB12]EED82611.1 predicted protein [Postia placenta Mad-698-R]OSX61668.1 hypothetical protein POSPLADRAFT_1046955 [Postia placenta MAD-698-R-SB12]